MNIPISVLMSVRNGEKHIKKSIESILNQTFDKFEFLIVNDGSDDNTLEIINYYSNLDKRIRIINKNKTGLSNSLNVGIDSALGDWIARIDSDDFCQLDRLELQYKLAISKKNIALIGSNIFEVSENEKISKYFKYPTDSRTLKKNLIKFKIFFAHSCFFFSRKVAIKIGKYREVFEQSQDLDLCLRISDYGEILSINKPLLTIRKHNGQMSHEENGLKQLIESRAAVTSYLVKKKGYNDPITEKNPKVSFLKFYKFIKQEIHINKYDKFYLFVKHLKFNYLNLESNNLLLFLNIIIRTPFFFLYFLNIRFRGDNYARTLTKKWIKSHIMINEK